MDTNTLANAIPFGSTLLCTISSVSESVFGRSLISNQSSQHQSSPIIAESSGIELTDQILRQRVSNESFLSSAPNSAMSSSGLSSKDSQMSLSSGEANIVRQPQLAPTTEINYKIAQHGQHVMNLCLSNLDAREDQRVVLQLYIHALCFLLKALPTIISTQDIQDIVFSLVSNRPDLSAAVENAQLVENQKRMVFQSGTEPKGYSILETIIIMFFRCVFLTIRFMGPPLLGAAVIIYNWLLRHNYTQNITSAFVRLVQVSLQAIGETISKQLMILLTALLRASAEGVRQGVSIVNDPKSEF